MTPRRAFIAHCESLGIHKSLATQMANEARACGWGYSERCKTAAGQYEWSFPWGHRGTALLYFHAAVYQMLLEMAKTGECK